MSTEFSLDARLSADTHAVMDLGNSSLRLMNDSRWPWLILVPRIANACEWHDLTKGQRIMIDDEVAISSRALKAVVGCEKINIAAIGNMVRQLHIHIVARNEGDANWPGPVWGFGSSIAYDPAVSAELIEKLNVAIKKESK